MAGRLRTHRDSEAASVATRRCYMRLNRAAEGLGLETCDEAAGTLHRGSCGAGAGARGGIVYNTGLWLARVRILHAICRTEQNSIWRGRFGELKIVPVFPREAAERRAPHGDAVMSAAKVEGPPFCGLTRVTLAPGGSLLTFNMERSGKPGPYLAVLKVGSLPPSVPGKQKCLCGSLLPSRHP